MNSPTVYIIDDDDDMRHSLECLLSAAGYRVRAFVSALAFLDALPVERPGCLIVDQLMPGMTGLELIERIHSGIDDALPTIFITAYADVPTAVTAMKGGALDFLEKPFDKASLLAQVDRALERDVRQQASHSRWSELQSRYDALTERERKTLALLREGLANKVMAARLGITERAVEMRRAAILRKMGASSTAELLEEVIELQFAKQRDRTR